VPGLVHGRVGQDPPEGPTDASEIVPGGNARVAASPFSTTTTVKAPRAMAFTGQAESGGMKYSTA